MQQRGKKSAAAAAETALTVISRPDAPLDLTPEQTDEWLAIVDSLPADWFQRETWPILSQYARHIVASRRVSQLIDAEMAQHEIDLGRLDKLLAMQARETAALKAAATSMRLTQQSTWNAKSGDTAKQKRTVKRLWDG